MSFTVEHLMMLHDMAYERAVILHATLEAKARGCNDPKCPDHGPRAIGEKSYQGKVSDSKAGPFQF